MNVFDRAVEFILRYEGDVSNDPRDSGGLTKFGISQKAYPALDILGLTREGAIEIYRQKYWDLCKCSQLPAPLGLILFDSAVNQGPTAAVRLFQKSLGVSADGMIGPETIAASFRVNLRATTSEFIARRAYQYALHPEVGRFGLGWFRRLSECHQVSLEPF